jgi:hypothetical protein
MNMNFRPCSLLIFQLFSLLACCLAAAQDVQTNVTYICNGERLRNVAFAHVPKTLPCGIPRALESIPMEMGVEVFRKQLFLAALHHLS